VSIISHIRIIYSAGYSTRQAQWFRMPVGDA
jgi:hypothetical protein